MVHLIHQCVREEVARTKKQNRDIRPFFTKIVRPTVSIRQRDTAEATEVRNHNRQDSTNPVVGREEPSVEAQSIIPDHRPTQNQPKQQITLAGEPTNTILPKRKTKQKSTNKQQQGKQLKLPFEPRR